MLYKYDMVDNKNTAVPITEQFWQNIRPLPDLVV
jgi:hypothetical protein